MTTITWRAAKCRRMGGAMSAATFMFADLSGYTAMTDIHGDNHAADVAHQYVSDLRNLADDHGAKEIKTVGDGVLHRVDDPNEALIFGVRIVNEVGQQHGSLGVSVGMDFGEAVERDSDYFGLAVNTAARLSDLAQANDVLLTENVHRATGELHGISVEEFAEQKLKGITEKVRIFSASRVGLEPEITLNTDPVCHMRIDPKLSPQKITFKGTEYFFCSDRCARLFHANPHNFVDICGCIFERLTMKPRKLDSGERTTPATWKPTANPQQS